jgi:hypothetical protein
MKFRALLFSMLLPLGLMAGPGDTLVVQAFTFGGPQDAVIQFPNTNQTYERVLMYYTLKCVPGGAGGLQYPCGEWDYLTYTYLYHPTGAFDSTQLTQSNVQYGPTAPDSVSFVWSPTYDVYARRQFRTVVDGVVAETTAEIGAGSALSASPFDVAHPRSRAQYLWLANELTAAGLVAGELDRLTLFLANGGGTLRGLTVRIKATNAASLDPGSPDLNGFATVYRAGTDLPASGPLTFDFSAPFVWNGTSNLLVEILYDNLAPEAGATAVESDTTGFASGLLNDSDDAYLDFDGYDYAQTIDNGLFGQLSDQITVSFWLYGAPEQPEPEYAFEGRNAQGQRVINAHLPWDNGRVYWDAGNVGGAYDRIDKQAQTADYEGRWNHWAFVKDAAAGTMQIFLNGALWHNGTGKTRLMEDIETFLIGKGGLGGANFSFYDGFIDEFQLWNTALDAATINAWRLREVDAAHPDYAHLLLYYRFDEQTPDRATDHSGHNGDAHLMGLPRRVWTPAAEKFKNFRATDVRPRARFHQGDYVLRTDTLVFWDTVYRDGFTLELFDHPTSPALPTDTLHVWAPGWSYVYDLNGAKADSVWIGADSTIYKTLRNYYGPPFEVVDRIELGRYITPYGINLDLGPDGWTWIYDVTDYLPVLRGPKRLTAGNWQELLDLKFLFIEGTPSRQPLTVQNVYIGDYGYGNSIPGNPGSIENQLTPRTVSIPAGTASALLKVRTTGHGFGGTLNCAEFCPRNNVVKLNGTPRFNQYLWDDGCALNPLFPQGGTWLYSRANWCPGKDVHTDEYELTPYITPGTSLAVDYDMQANYQWDGQGSYPTYVIESQVFTYGPNQFAHDARLEQIIAPNKMKIYGRHNPTCGGPIIRVRNTGSQTMTSLTVDYGITGGPSGTYTWTGSLPFNQATEIELPPFAGGQAWPDVPNQRFYATLSAPSGQPDEYAPNNTASSAFVNTPVIESDRLLLLFYTNGFASESSFVLKDENGNVVDQRQYVNNNQIHRDTLNVPPGCYTLSILDSDDDGLAFFANNDGGGWARVYRLGSNVVLHNFPADFGRQTDYRFVTRYPTGIDEAPGDAAQLEVFPVPTAEQVFVRLPAVSGNALMRIFDLTGRLVHQQDYVTGTDGMVSVAGWAPGTYWVTVQVGKQLFTGKIVVL